MSFILPIIPTDLHQFESYERAINALETLESVFSQSIDAICNRINECNTRVENISGKLSSAQAVLSKVEGTTKALNIQSATEFPKVATRDDQLIPNQLPPAKYHPTVHESSHPGEAPKGSIDDVNMLSQSYRANRVPAVSFLDMSQSHQELFLGNAPSSLTNITSLLLFNSEDNPYLITEVEAAPDRPSELVANRTGSIAPALPAGPGIAEEVDPRQSNRFVPVNTDTCLLYTSDAADE